MPEPTGIEAVRAFGERVLMHLMDPLAEARRHAGAAWYYRSGPGSELTPATIDALPDEAARGLAATMLTDHRALGSGGARLFGNVLGNVQREFELDRQVGEPVRAALFVTASAAFGAAHGYLGSGAAGAGAGVFAWIFSLGSEEGDAILVAREMYRASAAALTYEFFRGAPRPRSEAPHA